MNEFRDLYTWLAGNKPHHTVRVSRLPDPNFESDGRAMVSFSTNNYLGLATHPRLLAAARRGLERYGVGNCESRLLGGDLDAYHELEQKLAKLKGKPSALLFATGYLTNVGVLSALPRLSIIARFYGFRPKRRYSYAYLSDEFNHMSIREGIRLSGVEKIAYRHCDMNHLEECLKACDADMKVIVSDGVFSQDGDIAPLPEMVALAERYDALVYLDDAHGTGVLGANGGGSTEHYGIQSPRILSMGTLSKAYGAIGGFLAADQQLVDLLRLGSSAYSFTSTIPPDQTLAICEAIDVVREHPELREQMWSNQRYFLGAMDRLGFRLMARTTPIVPVWVGDEGECERLSDSLARRGYHVDSIVFPAVSKGHARLRFIMNAHHTRAQIDGVVSSMAELRERPVAATAKAAS